MRFAKVITFIMLLLFSLNVVAQTTDRAEKVNVSQVEFDSHPMAAEDTSADPDMQIAAGLIGGGAGALAAAAALAWIPVVGWVSAAAIGAAVAYGTYRTISPDESSFGKILNAFTSLNDGSWFSQPFNTIFNAINEITVATNSGLQSTMLTLLGLLMVYYILYVAIKAVVSFQPIEPAKLASDIFGPLLRCIIAAFFIRYWQTFFDMFITPLLTLGIEFGTSILNAVAPSEVYTASSSAGVHVVRAQCVVTQEGAGLGKEVCDALQTFLGTISQTLIVWMAFGATLLADCWGEGLWDVFPSFKMLAIGLIVFVFTFMVYVHFPMKLLDALFRLMFVVVLFPLWCVCWVIEVTRKNYFSKAVDLFVNVVVTFICASVVMVMVLGILSNLFNGIDVGKITQLLFEKKVEKAIEEIGFTGVGLFFSSCLLFMAWHLVSKVDYFTNIFAKQESLKIGDGMGAKTQGLMTWGMATGGSILANADKWSSNKRADNKNRSRAQEYNKNVPGGTARQSPRLWTNNPIARGIDAMRAKKQIGDYSRTADAVAGKVQKNADGSKQQTYSNRTVDRDGNTLSQMKETAWTSSNGRDQSVSRQKVHFDDAGNVRRAVDVKKDFQNGTATRKSTVKKNADGTKTVLSVDAASGERTRTLLDKHGNITSISKERVDSTGTRYKTTTDATGKLLSRQSLDKKGNLEKTTFAADGVTVAMTDRVQIDPTTGDRTTTHEEASGFKKETVQNSGGEKLRESTHKADGSSRLDIFRPGGTGLTREEKDSGGHTTAKWDVDLTRDEFFDILGGRRIRMTERWSDYSLRNP